MNTIETTASKLATLHNLRNQAGKLAYQRVKLAVEVFRDKQWVAEAAGDDIDKAAKILQENYLADLCGAISFFALVEIMGEFPTLEEWEDNKFNLTALSAQCAAKRKKTTGQRSTRTTVTVKMYEQLQEELRSLKSRLAKEERARKDAESKITQLDGQLQAAIRQGAEIKGQLAEARSTIDRLTTKKAS